MGIVAVGDHGVGEIAADLGDVDANFARSRPRLGDLDGRNLASRPADDDGAHLVAPAAFGAKRPGGGFVDGPACDHDAILFARQVD